MGSSFVLFDVSMEITLGQFRSGKSGYTQKMSFPVGKRYLSMGKRASVTTTIENVIDTAILLRNRSQRVNPSRNWSPRLIPSCKLYRGPVPATGPCDQSLRLVPSCVATLILL